MAFLYAGGVPILDQNLGKVELSISTKESGAIQISGVMRLNEKYLEDGDLLAALPLEDRFSLSVAAIGSSQTYQETFGYPPSNFIDPAAIIMI